LELDGKQQVAARLGEEVAAGTKLVEVAAYAVWLERAGVRQRVALEGQAAAVNSAHAAVVASVALPASTALPAAGSVTTDNPAVNAAQQEWLKMQRQQMARGRGL